LLAGRQHFAAGSEGLITLGLKLPREALFDAASLPMALSEGLAAGLSLLLPLAVATVIAAVVGSIALGGWAFIGTGLTPDFSRLSPLKGFGRIMSWNGLVELLKALAKFAVVAAVGALLLWYEAEEVLELGTLTLEAAFGRSAWLAGVCLAGLA